MVAACSMSQETCTTQQRFNIFTNITAMPFTQKQLKAIMPRCDAGQWIDSLNAAMDRFEINTPKRIAALLARFANENRINGGEPSHRMAFLLARCAQRSELQLLPRQAWKIWDRGDSLSSVARCSVLAYFLLPGIFDSAIATAE